MKGLDKLKRNRRTVLVKMAENLGVKVYTGLNKTGIAKRILEKQKLNELEEPESPESDVKESKPKPESKRKPEFESLATEGPEIAPELPQDEWDGRGGAREGAGRPPGSPEELRVQRIRRNKVPDPVIKFAFECLFEGWESAVKVKGLALSKDEADTITVPVTNLKEYYFPGLDLSPVLEMWIGLAIGVKAVVQGRIVLIREARKAEPVTQPTEGDNDAE